MEEPTNCALANHSSIISNNEVLTRIFSNLHVREYPKLRLICKKFDTIITKHLGLEMTIEANNFVDEPAGITEFGRKVSAMDPFIPRKFTMDPQEIDLITAMPLRVIHFGEIKNVEVPKFMRPDLVREVSFKGIIPTFLFDNLISQVENLTKLSIGVHVFQHLDCLELQLHLPNLKCFQICQSPHPFDDNRISDPMSCLGSMHDFLRTYHFPKIQTLEIHIKTFCEQDIDVIRNGVTSFILKHKKTLKTLYCLLETTTFRREFIPPSLLTEVIIPKISVNHPICLENFSLFYINKNIPATSLRFNNWYPLLRNLKRLKTLKLTRYINDRFLKLDDDVSPLTISCIPPKIVTQNKTTLKVIHLNIESQYLPEPVIIDFVQYRFSVDMTLFKDCANLQELVLEGQWVESSQPTTLVNVEHLPQSLKILKILNIVVRPKSLEIMSTRLSNLEKFQLKGDNQILSQNRKLLYNGYFPTECYISPPICQSMIFLSRPQNLHTISIDVPRSELNRFDQSTGDSEGFPYFNCNWIAQCRSLKILALRGPILPENKRTSDNTSNLKNLTHLPVSLTRLIIHNLALTNEDIRMQLLPRCESLSELILHNIGHTQSLGLSAWTVLKILEQRKLRVFKVDALNTELFHEENNPLFCPEKYSIVMSLQFGRTWWFQWNDGLQDYMPGSDLLAFNETYGICDGRQIGKIFGVVDWIEPEEEGSDDDDDEEEEEEEEEQMEDDEGDQGDDEDEVDDNEGEEGLEREQEPDEGFDEDGAIV